MTDQRPHILFLAHRPPWPPDRGDRIRSWHVLRALSAQAQVHCGCLTDPADAAGDQAPVIAITASQCMPARRKSIGWAGILALITGQPVSVAAFRSRRLQRWVHQTLATYPIEAIYVFSGQMAQFVPDSFRGRVIMDFVDVDSAKYAAYAANLRPGPVRVIHAREARVLSAYEQRVARRASLSLLVTPEERDLFCAKSDDLADIAVAVLGNGIDAAYFSPAPVAVPPDQPHPQIVFTGQMDYAPNIAAVEMFARQVMPVIRDRYPAAEFAIVGRAPVAQVRALHGVHGTRVTGEVADVRPWLAGADLVVAPLQIARGVQNKVLEAMAMARPVLLTPAAATGIGGENRCRDGEHFAIADGVQALAIRALALIDDRVAADAMGAAARAFVLAEAGWDKILAPLPAMVWPPRTEFAGGN